MDMIWTINRIIQNFKVNRGVKFSSKTITHFATKLGYRIKRGGGLVGYDQSLYTILTSHYPELVEYENSLKAKKIQKPKTPIDYNPDKFIEPEGRKDYAWESRINRCIMEAIDELELFHGSPHDFEQFDFAYMSTGWGQQAYGYGAYLTTEYECAKEYSKGGLIYTVEIPDKKYLNGDRVSTTLAMKVAYAFYRYYMNEDEYGREAYKGHEDEFWEAECKYIGECTDGNSLYGTISSFLGGDKYASRFFHDKLGYTGLLWTATNGNTGKKFKNYVIFDANDIRIIKKDSAV